MPELRPPTIQPKRKPRKNPEVDKRQCYPDGSYLRGVDLVNFVKAERGDTVLLSFSRGKDSIATWLYLRENGFEIVPFFMYLVPHMSWEDESLAYYEEFFGQQIMRLPHPAFYWMLNKLQWETPETVAVIRAMKLPYYNFATMDNLIAMEHGLSEPFCAMGIRQCDGLERRRLIQQMGVVGIGERSRRRFYYPIWDWNIEQISRAILKAGVRLPADYNLFGRTVVALNYRRLREIKRQFPADYARILEWFPLAELEIFRYEQVGAG